jgi:hypothetical protein
MLKIQRKRTPEVIATTQYQTALQECYSLFLFLAKSSVKRDIVQAEGVFLSKSGLK